MKKKGRDSESDQRQIGRFSIIDLMNKQLATTLKAVEAAIYYSIQSRLDLLVHGEPRVPASNATYRTRSRIITILQLLVATRVRFADLDPEADASSSRPLVSPEC